MRKKNKIDVKKDATTSFLFIPLSPTVIIVAIFLVLVHFSPNYGPTIIITPPPTISYHSIHQR